MSTLSVEQIATLIAAVAACGLLAAALTLHLLRRRYRRQVEALLDRLAELEERLEEGNRADPVGLEAEPADEPVELLRPLDSPVPGDVLAGKTSYVRRAVQGTGAEAESLAGQALACVHRHLDETLSPAGMADHLHISLRTLERGLAAALSCTPTQLIVAMKMREARRLLQSGSVRVNEVAYRLGFSSPYHFSRRFKEFYGVTPSDLTRRDTAA